MRIKFLLSGTDKALPINNQHIVNSFIHRVIGPNNEHHDSQSIYSVSSLYGGKWIKGTKSISFVNGGYITISSLNKDFLDSIILKIYKTPFHLDIKVVGMEFIEETFYNGWNHFATLSPFLIKESDKRFLTLKDDNFEYKVKQYLINKLRKMDSTLDLSDFDVKIPQNKGNKVKCVFVKSVPNFANQCHISIRCNKKVANLLYNTGIGKSTGSGFGTIYKTENKSVYR